MAEWRVFVGEASDINREGMILPAHNTIRKPNMLDLLAQSIAIAGGVAVPPGTPIIAGPPARVTRRVRLGRLLRAAAGRLDRLGRRLAASGRSGAPVGNCPA